MDRVPREAPPHGRHGAAGTVRAFAPAGVGRQAVVRWAVHQAGLTGARLELVVDAQEAPPRAARGPLPALLDLLCSPLRALARTVAVLPPDGLAARIGRAGAGAGLLVVPQSLPGVPELVDRAYDPVVVVPAHGADRTRAPVVVAVAPWTGPEVLQTAAGEAIGRGVPLVVVRLEGSERRGVVGAEHTGAAGEVARRALEDDTAIWTVAYPELRVEVRTVDRDPVTVLVELSGRAGLVVVGRSTRGRLLSYVTPSPVGPVLVRSRCPVLVVPPEGPPRRTLWAAGDGDGPLRRTLARWR